MLFSTVRGTCSNPEHGLHFQATQPQCPIPCLQVKGEARLPQLLFRVKLHHLTSTPHILPYFILRVGPL